MISRLWFIFITQIFCVHCLYVICKQQTLKVYIIHMLQRHGKPTTVWQTNYHVTNHLLCDKLATIWQTGYHVTNRLPYGKPATLWQTGYHVTNWLWCDKPTALWQTGYDMTNWQCGVLYCGEVTERTHVIATDIAKSDFTAFHSLSTHSISLFISSLSLPYNRYYHSHWYCYNNNWTFA